MMPQDPSIEERLALLEERLASPTGEVSAREIRFEEEQVDPDVRLAELRKERGALAAEMRRKASPAERRQQERHAAALDAAILAFASSHEPEAVLAGLLEERDQSVHDATRGWQPEHAHLPGALTKVQHDQRVKDAGATIAHIDEQIEHYEELVRKLHAAS
jgi:hypothetical protein